jgi:hypothetical protein
VVDNPYSTWVLLGWFVVQVIDAPVEVMPDTATLEITGVVVPAPDFSVVAETPVDFDDLFPAASTACT